MLASGGTYAGWVGAPPGCRHVVEITVVIALFHVYEDWLDPLRGSVRGVPAGPELAETQLYQ